MTVEIGVCRWVGESVDGNCELGRCGRTVLAPGVVIMPSVLGSPMMMMMMIVLLLFALKGHVEPAGSPTGFRVPSS